MQPDFTAALPTQITAEKFVRTTMTAVQMNPALLQGDRRSLLGACMKAAQDGLMLDGREAALVVFGQKIQYMPMIGGILKKLRNSGDLLTISANVVFEKDIFDFTLGDDEKISHKPYLGRLKGDIIAVYAIAKTKDGGVYREVMTIDQVEKVRASSRASGAGPWTQWFDEMAKKTVIRRLCKRLPSSADIDQVFASEAEVTGFAPPVQLQESIQPVPASRLKQSMAKVEEQEVGDDGDDNAEA
jgi:recombination protein RecT